MQRFKNVILFVTILSLILSVSFPAVAQSVHHSSGSQWYLGFGSAQILPDPDSEQPLYIAGYNSGWEISGVLDYCEARAVWLDTGDQGILMIGIDCVALSSGTVERIRRSLADLTDCAAINVYATHTHAGIDTLGLWGPMGIDGKNDDYMDALVKAAEAAGRAAATDRRAGTLRFGLIDTENMYRDSRIPLEYDDTLYHLRFVAEDGSAGTRMLFYGAHAESLRGSNTMLSRDFPGILCDQVTAETGDRTMFLPGAIGGLTMTREFVNINSQSRAIENLQITGDLLTEYALAINAESEETIAPQLSFSREIFTVPLDNTAFLLYEFLGILDHTAVRAQSATGYAVQTELCVLRLDKLVIALIPGEIFPELVSGSVYGDANKEGVNPRPLQEIATDYGAERLLVVGLCNDEIGYIVPPSDFLLNKDLPYLDKTMDYKGENHYEETNSVGPACADAIANAFEAAISSLQ